MGSTLLVPTLNTTSSLLFQKKICQFSFLIVICPLELSFCFFCLFDPKEHICGWQLSGMTEFVSLSGPFWKFFILELVFGAGRAIETRRGPGSEDIKADAKVFFFATVATVIWKLQLQLGQHMLNVKSCVGLVTEWRFSQPFLDCFLKGLTKGTSASLKIDFMRRHYPPAS